MTHKFGPNGHIVGAFIACIKGMTPEQWKPVIADYDADYDAAWDAAWDAARDAAGYAARDAAYEIQGADLMRERGQPFSFLPLFGFADETEVACLVPKDFTKPARPTGTDYPDYPTPPELTPMTMTMTMTDDCARYRLALEVIVTYGMRLSSEAVVSLAEIALGDQT